VQSKRDPLGHFALPAGNFLLRLVITSKCLSPARLFTIFFFWDILLAEEVYRGFSKFDILEKIFQK
jgi:hypothetical protein